MCVYLKSCHATIFFQNIAPIHSYMCMFLDLYSKSCRFHARTQSWNSHVPAVLHSINAYIVFVFALAHQTHMQESGKLQEKKDLFCDDHMLNIRGFSPDIIDYLPTNSVLSPFISFKILIFQG